MASKGERVEFILKHVAEAENIKNSEIIPSEEALRGDGFLSEGFTGQVRNKDTGEVTEVYMKLPPKYKMIHQNAIYKNECMFYSKLFPEFDKFQKEKEVKEPFDNFAKFYCGDVVPDEEYVALENLQVKNYSITNKAEYLDEKHLKILFKTYGKLHALTFSYKDQNREKYEELVAPVADIFKDFKKQNKGFTPWLAMLIDIACKKIKETDKDRAEKLEKFKENVDEAWSKGAFYSGKYSCFTHGDCWSNNFMFKYDKDNNIEDLKVIDLQLIRDSTPVHDLSYFFYAGASKKDLDKLDEYLDLYYDSFSTFVKELGSDPEKLLPMEALKEDWKVASLLGVLMALVIWQIKLVPREAIQEMGKQDENNMEDTNSTFSKALGNVRGMDVFVNIISDVLNHAIDYNII